MSDETVIIDGVTILKKYDNHVTRAWLRLSGAATDIMNVFEKREITVKEARHIMECIECSFRADADNLLVVSKTVDVRP